MSKWTLAIMFVIGIGLVIVTWVFAFRYFWEPEQTYTALNALFAGLAFVVIAITLFFQQSALREQQRHSSKPEIILLQDPIYIYSWKFDDRLIPVVWCEHELSENEIKEQAMSTAYFRIVNIGNGAACQIKLLWEIDLDQTNIHDFNKFNSQHSIPVAIKKNGDTVGIRLRFPREKIQMNLKADLENGRDYLLPASSEPDGWRCKTPFTLSEITAAMLYVFNLSSDRLIEGGDRYYDSPDFNLKISYKDISGHRYNKKFSGKIEFTPRSGHNADFLAHWNFKETG